MRAFLAPCHASSQVVLIPVHVKGSAILVFNETGPRKSQLVK